MTLQTEALSAERGEPLDQAEGSTKRLERQQRVVHHAEL